MPFRKRVNFSLMKYLALLASLLCLGCASQSNGPSAGEMPPPKNGRADAKKDIAANHMCLKGYGLPLPATEQYAALLKQDLNITYQQVGGCMIDDALIKYVHDYNKVILDYIAKTHGPKTIHSIWEKAQKEYEATMKLQTSGT
ncbi:hypothetical protein BH09VER1_BH09VER1_43300 [soil metagenome]